MLQTSITMRVSLNGTVTGKIGEYEFGARVHDEVSMYGIQDGRISRLSFTKGTDIVLFYDKGWFVPVPDHCKEEYQQVMKVLEQLPA